MNDEHPIVQVPNNILLLTKNNRTYHQQACIALVVDTHQREYEALMRWENLVRLLMPDGQIVRTFWMGTSGRWKMPRLLASHRLTPLIDVDEFVDDCFTVGYEEVRIGPTAYAELAFGVQCKPASGEEARIDGWPAIWNLAEKHGLYAGCGGHHSAQLVRFVPIGRFKFGTHVKR